MEYEAILANLHLHAVLPRIQELVKLDAEAREIASQIKSVIRFYVRGGPSVQLDFRSGQMSADLRSGLKTDVGLFFNSCEQLNRMFKGGKVIPLPYKGLTKLGDLKKFTKLSEMLTRYLQPSESDLRDSDFRMKHVEMSLMVGMAGASVLAKTDPKMARCVQKLHDGTVLINVKPIGPQVHVRVVNYELTVINGPVDNPSAVIELKDLDTAVELLSGKLDAFAAIGACDLMITGLIPLADEVNALLDRVGYYLG